MTQKPNFQRMFAIIDEVFATRNDPYQLQVDGKVMEKLAAIHPATLGEVANENGPLIWVLMIPTTKEVMDDFLQGKISEKEILDHTQPGEMYDCIYLCSATTLREKRGFGDTKKLCLQQIEAIRKDHSIKHLYLWPFSSSGEKLAIAISEDSGLELFKKN